MSTVKNQNICIIGAGISGLCAAKHLAQKGFKRISIFETTSRLGGTWNYESDRNYPNPMYKNLITNLPHKLMQYPDFPFPKELSQDKHPHRSMVLEYIKKYADHFSLHPFVKYNHKIVKLVPPSTNSTQALNINELPKWTVYIESILSRSIHVDQFDSVIVCNGHYTKPFIPHFVGLENFKKTVLHSRYYREPEEFDNKVIVIVGYQASGVDIGMEIFSKCNTKIYQVTHGRKVTKTENNKYYVDDERFIYKGNIRKFGYNSSVEFDDGLIVYPDVIIFCTGYLYDFAPFLDNQSLPGFRFGNSVDGLFQQTIYPHIPSLFFVCLSLQVVPALVAHVQCQWIAKILSDLRCQKNENGLYEFTSAFLPSKHNMMEWIKMNKMDSGRKEQMRLGVKQFRYMKEVCLLSKEDVPWNITVDLNALEHMYANKKKPYPSVKAKL
eukprot:121263_1